MDGEIRDVSDTALWIAAYRALESDKPDGLFRDPLAARLAGERGLSLGRSMPGGPLVHWSIALRTVGIDRLIESAIIELKNRELARETPVCALERVALDVTDRARRTEVLERVTAGSTCTVVITEGVLPYLEEADVNGLIEDVRRVPSVRYWIQEYYNKGGLRSMTYQPWRRRLKAAASRRRTGSRSSGSAGSASSSTRA